MADTPRLPADRGNGMLSKTIVILYRPREPFEIAVLTLCILAGLIELIFGPTPGSAADHMPFARWAWLVLGAGGSAVAMTGVLLWHRAMAGIVMEAIGLCALAIGLGLNGFATIFLTITGEISDRHLASGPLAMLWAWAAWTRFRRVKCEIHKIEHAHEETE